MAFGLASDELELQTAAQSFIKSNAGYHPGDKVYVTADGTVFHTLKAALEAHETLKNMVICGTTPERVLEPIEYTVHV